MIELQLLESQGINADLGLMCTPRNNSKHIQLCVDFRTRPTSPLHDATSSCSLWLIRNLGKPHTCSEMVSVPFVLSCILLCTCNTLEYCCVHNTWCIKLIPGACVRGRFAAESERSATGKTGGQVWAASWNQRLKTIHRYTCRFAGLLQNLMEIWTAEQNTIHRNGTSDIIANVMKPAISTFLWQNRNMSLTPPQNWCTWLIYSGTGLKSR
jgi:hypothetical protein